MHLTWRVRALNFSATVAIGEEEEKPSSIMTTVTMVVSLLFAIGLFFILPAFLASLVERLGATPLMREFAAGLIRLLIFLGYIIAISRLPDIQRVFGYHGAEHKTINAYEAGEPLTVASVQRFTLIHPRCGTSFLLVVLYCQLRRLRLCARSAVLATVAQPYPAYPADRGYHL